MDQAIAGLLIGRALVGRYEIEELIGRGGMSVVYRATDRRLEREVAVKVIALPPGTPDEHAVLRERLRREAASAARIPPHPNVVQVYDYGADPDLGVDFIVMELLQGRELKQLLRKGRPTSTEALRIVADAARGVSAGHRAGIVHRDLKPANIILAEDGGAGTVKILDFGIAKALQPTGDDDLTRTGFVPHSPAYASPEQMQPGVPLTATSDVYQLGLIGYELLTGERPYSPGDLARIAAGEEVPVPDRGHWRDVPAEVRAVIGRALSQKADRRYPDAGAFADAIADAQDEGTIMLADQVAPAPVAAPPEQGGPAPGWRPARRGIPMPVQLAVGALVALAALWMVLGRNRKPPADAAPVVAIPAAEAAALDEEFRELEVEAHRNLTSRETPAEGTAAARAVDAVVQQLTRAWVDGDIERHISFYGENVRFYGRRVPRSRVARDRAETLVQYPARTITLDRTLINFPEPEEATVLVDKSWSFKGEDRSWEGAARQEFRLEQREGQWRVVGERNVEVFRSDRDP